VRLCTAAADTAQITPTGNPVRDGQKIREGCGRRVGEPVDATGECDHVAGGPHSVQRTVGQPAP